MKTTHYHPSDELLTAFAAASLPLSQALCVSTHLEYCRECRFKLQQLDGLGAELFQHLKPASPSTDLRQRVLQQLDQHPASPPPSPQAGIDNYRSGPQGIPRCLRQFIPRDFNNMPWRRVSTAIRNCVLCWDTNGAKVELLRIKPGGSSGTHTHLGEEFTVILQGSFSDEEGLYRRGDFVARSERHRHTPVATHDEECICLAVTSAPIQFTGFFSRWLNPLLRRSYQV